MSFSSIVYFGPRGLETDIFKSYMSCSGYNVQVVTNGSLDSPSGTPLASCIAVIALQKKTEELVRLAREIRSQSNGGIKRIFILADDQPIPVQEPKVEVIERPFRLSELIKRIQVLNREE